MQYVRLSIILSYIKPSKLLTDDSPTRGHIATHTPTAKDSADTSTNIPKWMSPRLLSRYI